MLCRLRHRMTLRPVLSSHLLPIITFLPPLLVITFDELLLRPPLLLPRLLKRLTHMSHQVAALQEHLQPEIDLCRRLRHSPLVLPRKILMHHLVGTQGSSRRTATSTHRHLNLSMHLLTVRSRLLTQRTIGLVHRHCLWRHGWYMPHMRLPHHCLVPTTRWDGRLPESL